MNGLFYISRPSKYHIITEQTKKTKRFSMSVYNDQGQDRLQSNMRLMLWSLTKQEMVSQHLQCIGRKKIIILYLRDEVKRIWIQIGFPVSLILFMLFHQSRMLFLFPHSHYSKTKTNFNSISQMEFFSCQSSIVIQFPLPLHSNSNNRFCTCHATNAY